MKKIALSLLTVTLLMGAALCNSSCSKEKIPEAKTTKTTAKKDSNKSLPNYRYVDSDTLLEKYNLAKDYQEEMLRMQNNLDNTARQQQSSIESLAAQYQQKQQNNGYTSQQEVERDMRNLQQKQTAAQNTLGKMQTDLQTQMATAQRTVQDSIMNYIKEYNATKGYDAIFMKAATLYIDPALDITDEVLEGLNARYNKMKK